MEWRCATDRGMVLCHYVVIKPARLLLCSLVVSIKGDRRAQRAPTDIARFAVDLKHSDLQSPKLTSLLTEFSKLVGGQILVNTDRYVCDLDQLVQMLTQGHRVGCTERCMIRSCTQHGPLQQQLAKDGCFVLACIPARLLSRPCYAACYSNAQSWQWNSTAGGVSTTIVCTARPLQCLCAQAFHPDVDLHQQHAYLSFHMADLTSCPEAQCVALNSKVPLLTLRTHKVSGDNSAQSVSTWPASKDLCSSLAS